MYEVKDSENNVLAIIDDIMWAEKGLQFYGTPKDRIQVATFNYDKDHEMRNHIHKLHPVNISQWKTEEFLIVLTGKVEVRVFDNKKQLIYTTVLQPMSYVISYDGGIGYTVLDNNTKMIEVKAGQFPGSELDRDLIE